MKSIGVIALLVLMSISVHSQESLKFPDANWKVNRKRTFDGGSLYGYINGGAVLYQEFGLKSLQVWELTRSNEEYTLQIYHMNDDTAAFGIWSVNHSQCDSAGILLRHDCSNAYQYQAALGNYYLSVLNNLGNKSSQDYSLQLGGFVLHQLSGTLFEIPETFCYLTGENSSLKSLCFRGEIALQNSFADWAPAFENLDEFTGYLFHNSMEGWTLCLISGLSDLEQERVLTSLSSLNKEEKFQSWFLNANHTLILSGRDNFYRKSVENRILGLLKER